MKYIIGLLLLAIALVIPTTLVFAFNASWAIKVDCSNGNFVTFHPSFTNNDQTKSFNVFVKENQSGTIVDLGTVQPGKTVEGIIATNLLTIPAGSVQFKIVDSSDQNSIDYQDLSYDATYCNGPTPTPSPELSVTPTPGPAQLIVIGGIDNTNGGTANLTDANVHINATNASPANFPAPDYPLTVTLMSGFFSVEESNLPGYVLTEQGDCRGTINSGEQKTCNFMYKFFSPTATPTVTPTETLTPTPTDSDGNNNCDNTNQSGNNDNNNCNQQNQNQDQDQTQNNNQNVNITINGAQPQVLAASATAQLPSTGTPVEVWELLGSLAPLGVFLRKFSNK